MFENIFNEMFLGNFSFGIFVVGLVGLFFQIYDRRRPKH